MWDGWMHGGWGWGFGMAGMVLFWLAVVVALVFATRVLIGRPGARDGGTGHAVETPLEILRRRYARGEIDREEYEEKKRDLS